MRAILIDPKTKEISEIKLETQASTLEALRDAIRCDYLDALSLFRSRDGFDVTMWVDDEGLFPSDQSFFEIITFGQPIGGRAVILATNDDGESVSLPDDVTLDMIKKLIAFVEYEKNPEPEIKFFEL